MAGQAETRVSSLRWSTGRAEQSHRRDPNGCSYSDFNNGGRGRRNPVTFRTPGVVLWMAIREKSC